jgi:Zyg-11 family protein
VFQFSSAILFYIMKDKEKHAFGVREKRRLISTLINGMGAHKSEDIMMRNGCLTLFQFKIPDDMVCYDSVVYVFCTTCCRILLCKNKIRKYSLI